MYRCLKINCNWLYLFVCLVKPNNTNKKIEHMKIRIQKLESDSGSTLEYMEKKMKIFRQGIFKKKESDSRDDKLLNKNEIGVYTVDAAVQTLPCRENAANFALRGLGYEEPIKVEIGVQTISRDLQTNADISPDLQTNAVLSRDLQTNGESANKKVEGLTKQLIALQDENESLRHDVKISQEDKVFYETFYMENAQNVAETNLKLQDHQIKGATFDDPISAKKIIDEAAHVCFTSSCNSKHHGNNDICTAVNTLCNTSVDVSSKMNLCSFDIPYIDNKTSVNACDASDAACDDTGNNIISHGIDKVSTEYDTIRDSETSPIVNNIRETSLDHSALKDSHALFDTMGERANTSAKTSDSSVNTTRNNNDYGEVLFDIMHDRDNTSDASVNITRDNTSDASVKITRKNSDDKKISCDNYITGTGFVVPRDKQRDGGNTYNYEQLSRDRKSSSDNVVSDNIHEETSGNRETYDRTKNMLPAEK